MNHKTKLNPVAAAVGAAFAINLAAVSVAFAGNPFSTSDLGGGYQVAESLEGKGEGRCGEGKCGVSRMDADSNGSVSKEEFMKAHDEMFNTLDKNSDGSLGVDEMKGHREGKCGEGKCGANKPS